MEHYSDQERGLCESFGNCARVVSDMGGPAQGLAGRSRTFAGIEAKGSLWTGRPIARLADDSGEEGIVRSEDLLYFEIPRTCSYASLVDHLVSSGADFITYSQKIQEGIHDDVHDSLGGLMPTYASPADPLFLVWHSSIDLMMHLWESCHLDTAKDVPPLWKATSCARTDDGKKLFPSVGFDDTLYMRAGDDDIRDDPLIGKYFTGAFTSADVANARRLGEYEFTYDHITQPLWDLLTDPTCPHAGNWTSGPTIVPAATPPPPDPGIIGSWLEMARWRLMDACPDSSKVLDAQMAFLSCYLSDGKRALPAESFLNELLAGNAVDDPRCNFFLEGLIRCGEDPVKLNIPEDSAPYAGAVRSSPNFGMFVFFMLVIFFDVLVCSYTCYTNKLFQEKNLQ